MNCCIKVYKHSDKNFSGGGIGIIENAKDVCVSNNINGDLKLEFTLHVADNKKGLAIPENVCRVGEQLFRIRTVDDGKVTADGIYKDAARKHIQLIDDIVGEKPIKIMEEIFKGTPIKVLTEAEVRLRGMEWVDDLTDFFMVSKITPIGALNNLIDMLNKYGHHSEVYVDNYNIAIVKQIGRDRGARLDPAYNVKEMTVKRDTSQLITRLFPYGKDGLHIGSVNHGAQYIESENYKEWECEGYQDFDDIEDPTELLDAAKWLFNADNPDRIDVPRYSITAGYACRNRNEIELGDIVTVVDRDYDVKTKQRVIEVRTYPFEANRDEITVGNPPKTEADVVAGIVNAAIGYENSINSRGDIKTAAMENLLGGYSTEINKRLAGLAKAKRPAAIHASGDIWVNPDNDNQALAIVGGVLAMANKKNDKGDWVWSAFGDWTGFTADKIVAGTINTSKIAIESSDKTTQFIGDLLTMYDTNQILRLKMGQEGSGYSFCLNNREGTPTLELDDSGDIRLKGILYTIKDKENAAGYIIENEVIAGFKRVGNKLVRHGLNAGTNQYGPYIKVYEDGNVGIHISSFVENGKQTTTFAVNNTSDDDEQSQTDLRAFDCIEGAEYATTRGYGVWDFSNAVLKSDGESGLNGGVWIGDTCLTLSNGLIIDVKTVKTENK